MATFDAEACLQLIEAHGVQWTFMVPTMMLRIWRLPAEVRARYDLSPYPGGLAWRRADA
jgi:bile acid-coenzyme A ligase